MLEEICREIRNFFVTKIYKGPIEISDGMIHLPDGFLLQDQYYFVLGSVFNDGVHKFPEPSLKDESFYGEVWAMAVPQAVIALEKKISEFVESDEGSPSSYQSESWGGYSYTKASGTDGVPLTWKSVFKNELARWRRI